MRHLVNTLHLQGQKAELQGHKVEQHFAANVSKMANGQ